MAIHPELAKNGSGLIKLLNDNFNLELPHDAKIKFDDVGRLSFAFEISDKSGKPAYFGKISKSGSGYENTELGPYITEEARKSGGQFAKTYPSKQGEFFLKLDKANIGEIPKDLIGQKLIIQEYREKTEIDEAAKEKLGDKIYHAIGAYNGNIILTTLNLKPESLKSHGVNTADPLSFEKIEKLIYENIGITDKSQYTRAASEAAIKANIHNLSDAEPVSAAYKQGLAAGRFAEVRKHIKRIGKALSEQDVKQLTEAWVNNDVKQNNVFLAHDPATDKVSISTGFDFDLAGRAPAVKDLGRTISFCCFSDDGKFNSAREAEIIKGFVETSGLKNHEFKNLDTYIELGLLASIALRSSYLKNELLAQPEDIELKKLDPWIHLDQLDGFAKWKEKNDFSKFLADALESPEVGGHRRFSYQARRTLNDPTYQIMEKRGFDMSAYGKALGSAHDYVDNVPGAREEAVRQIDIFNDNCKKCFSLESRTPEVVKTFKMHIGFTEVEKSEKPKQGFNLV